MHVSTGLPDRHMSAMCDRKKPQMSNFVSPRRIRSACARFWSGCISDTFQQSRLAFCKFTGTQFCFEKTVSNYFGSKPKTHHQRHGVNIFQMTKPWTKNKESGCTSMHVAAITSQACYPSALECLFGSTTDQALTTKSKVCTLAVWEQSSHRSLQQGIQKNFNTTPLRK